MSSSMSVAGDFHHSEGFVMEHMILSALGGLMLAWRRLGMAAVLVGMLSACSTQAKSGMAAVDAKETPKNRYIHQVMEQMRKKWSYYSSQKPYDVAYGDLPVEFTVNVEGKAENIHVRNTPKTNPDLTRFTVKSIQEAKLPPMPADVISALKVQDEGRLKLGFIVHHRPPQEETKRQDSSASDGKKTTVKLTATPKERYIQRVTQAVEKKWHRYRKMELAGITYGSLKVVFYVNKKGQVEAPRVVDDRNSYRGLPHTSHLTQTNCKTRQSCWTQDLSGGLARKVSVLTNENMSQ